MAVFSSDDASEPFDGHVVGLGAAAGEDDLFGGSVDESGNLFASGVDGFADFFGGTVATGGVVPVVAEVGEHGLDDLGVDGGGGVVVEIGHGLLWRMS